jgi:hypothetical protein
LVALVPAPNDGAVAEVARRSGLPNWATVSPDNAVSEACWSFVSLDLVPVSTAMPPISPSMEDSTGVSSHLSWN